MKKYLFTGLLSVVPCAFLILYLFCAKESPVQPDTGNYTGAISGCVYSRLTNGPINGVVVSIDGDSAVPDVSHDGGLFEIGKVEEGTHVLHFTHSDYEDTNELTVEITPGQKKSVDTVRLSYAWYILKGTVLTKAGGKAEGAGVVLANTPYSVLADDNGVFVMDKIAKRTGYRLVCARGGDGFNVLSPIQGMTDDTTVIPDIRLLLQGATVSGTVFDTLDKPVIACPVSAISGVLRDTTGDNGSYMLRNIPSNEPSVNIIAREENGLIGGFAGMELAEGGYAPSMNIHLRKATDFVNGMAIEASDVLVADTAEHLTLTALGLSDGSVRITSYEWFIDDDEEADTVTDLPFFRIALSKINALAPGLEDIPVGVRAKNSDDEYSDPGSFMVQVRGVKPKVTTSASATPDSAGSDTLTIEKGHVAYLTAQVFAPFGGVDTISWTFGDGTPPAVFIDSLAPIGHIYDSVATYLAVFTVSAGGDVTIDTVVVKIIKPVIEAPVPIWPADNDTAGAADDTIILSWHPVEEEKVTYNVYLDARNTFPVVQVASSVKDTTLVLKVENNTIYYWAVEVVSDKAKARTKARKFFTRTGLGNTPPRFITAAADMTDSAWVGSEYCDTVVAEDAESGVTYSFIDSVPGMKLSGGVITWTPAVADTGSKTVTVAAVDEKDAGDSLIWRIAVIGMKNSAPVFASKPADMRDTAFTGKTYCDTLHAVDAERDSLRFAFVEFVTGMQLVDSIVTWSPDATGKGSFTVSVSVSDGTAEANLSWTITVALVPVITRNPVEVTVTDGQSFTLAAGAAGDSLKFKWQKDVGTISGAVDSIYRVVQSTPAHAGLYRCIVYNSLGADTSDTARVRVNPFVAKVVYVKADAAEGGDGSSWTKAFRNFQEGINKVVSGNKVWVAAGVYTPDTTGKGRDASFSMKDGVEIYGGFAGTETILDQRNQGANKTVLSGDIGIPGDSTDNCYHVIYNPAAFGITSSAVLDGFTVSGGNANASTGITGCGGGMYNDGAWPVVRNCAFDSNTVYYLGGAMYNTGGSRVRVENTVFTGNKSTNSSGGAVYSDASNATFIACTFEGNVATSSGNGGALYATGLTVTIDRCFFTSNQAGNDGGAVAILNSSSSMICASSFTNNQSGTNWGGGGVYLSSCGGGIIGCTFQSNRAPGRYGGGIFLGTCSTLISACTFYSNIAAYGGAVYSELGTEHSLVNCTMSGNQATSSGGAFCFNTSKARVVNNIFWDNGVGGNLNDIGFYWATDSLFLLNNSMQQPVAASAVIIDSGTVTTDPLLSALASNGGEVFTCALGESSPALDVGVYVYKDTDGRLCCNKDGGTSYFAIEDGSAYTPKGTPARVNATDSRGVTRPQGSGIDLGAYEKE